MAELYDEVGSLVGDSNTKPVEVIPEMLDYNFVENCNSPDELRAVMAALRKGASRYELSLCANQSSRIILCLPLVERRGVREISRPRTNRESEAD